MSQFDEQRQRYAKLHKEANSKRKEILADYEAVKQEIQSQIESKLEKARAKLTEKELFLIKWAQDTEKVVKKKSDTHCTISIILGFIIAFGTPLLYYFTGLVNLIDKRFAVLVFVGSMIGGYFLSGLLISWILDLVTGIKSKERTIKEIYDLPKVKTYLREYDEALKEQKEWEAKIKEADDECNKWAGKELEVDHSEHVWNVMEKVGKVINSIEEWASSSNTYSSDSTTTIYKDGWDRRDLSLEERQGGYDTTHGWHDVYVDDMGHKYGSTDGGQTFFEKD